MRKSPGCAPVRLTLPIVSGAVPVLVTITTCWELRLPITVCPYSTLLGLMTTAGAAGAVPVPLRGTLCGLPAALLVKNRVAARPPVARGMNSISTHAEPLGGIELAVLPVPRRRKSAACGPEIEKPPTVRGALPVLVSVTRSRPPDVPTWRAP